MRAEADRRGIRRRSGGIYACRERICTCRAVIGVVALLRAAIVDTVVMRELAGKRRIEAIDRLVRRIQFRTVDSIRTRCADATRRHIGDRARAGRRTHTYRAGRRDAGKGVGRAADRRARRRHDSRGGRICTQRHIACLRTRCRTGAQCNSICLTGGRRITKSNGACPCCITGIAQCHRALAIADVAVANGDCTIASGSVVRTFGNGTIADGAIGITDRHRTIAVGDLALAEGYRTCAAEHLGILSASEGTRAGRGSDGICIADSHRGCSQRTRSIADRRSVRCRGIGGLADGNCRSAVCHGVNAKGRCSRSAGVGCSAYRRGIESGRVRSKTHGYRMGAVGGIVIAHSERSIASCIADVTKRGGSGAIGD